MEQFLTYLTLGLQHILDPEGLDHILFVIALTVAYNRNHWKNILWLITAFTIGHSLTLALAALEIIIINSQLIEILIPITILITSISNVVFFREGERKFSRTNYYYALFFGLIHGMGFSNYFRSLLGKSFTIIHQLLAFNIGLEIGQVLIISLFLIIGFLILDIFKVNKRAWVILVSTFVAIKAIHLIIVNVG